MPDFLETIETIRAEEASIGRLFNTADGTPIRGRRNDPAYTGMLTEAATLVADVLDGRRPVHYLTEALTTSDFPMLFGDILDRQLLAGYRETPQVWNQYAKRGSVRDFRTVKRFFVDGGEGRLTGVAERSPYPAGKVDEGKYQYSVSKFGKRFPISWETLINDDLDALKDAPARMARSARRTEEYFATDLFFGASGPDTTFFASGNNNIVTSNPALSIAALQTAFTILAAQRDTDGEPILIDAAVLVIPPALEVVAQNILQATTLRVTAAAAGGATGQELEVANWMRNKLKLAVNPYIPIIATTNGNTSWMLVADPSSGRPAAEVGFLRGHEEPELFMKSPNATRVGSGAADVMNGDFDTDSVDYKVRHVLGGTLMDPKMAVASNGSGS